VPVVAHRASALAAVDYVLAMAGGRLQAFGPKDEVLSRMMRREPSVVGPLKVVPQANG
jgi:ABC-type protease/lipase transport system fused ATPase/permease subunit